MIAALREKIGAGLLDCKKALDEAQGNMEQADTILRKKGAASAAKKAGRSTSEGLVESYIHVGGKVGSAHIACSDQGVSPEPASVVPGNVETVELGDELITGPLEPVAK